LAPALHLQAGRIPGSFRRGVDRPKHIAPTLPKQLQLPQNRRLGFIPPEAWSKLAGPVDLVV